MTKADAIAAESRALPSQRRDLLVFELGKELFALPIDQVREVLPLAALTALAAAPPGFAGMLRLRGALLPVVHLRQRLGLPTIAPQFGQCIIAIQLYWGAVGLLVDGVREIVIGREGPETLEGPNGLYVHDVLQAQGQVVAVLNAEAAIGESLREFLTAILHQGGRPTVAADGDLQPGKNS